MPSKLWRAKCLTTHLVLFPLNMYRRTSGGGRRSYGLPPGTSLSRAHDLQPQDVARFRQQWRLREAALERRAQRASISNAYGRQFPPIAPIRHDNPSTHANWAIRASMARAQPRNYERHRVALRRRGVPMAITSVARAPRVRVMLAHRRAGGLDNTIAQLLNADAPRHRRFRRNEPPGLLRIRGAAADEFGRMLSSNTQATSRLASSRR